MQSSMAPPSIFSGTRISDRMQGYSNSLDSLSVTSPFYAGANGAPPAASPVLPPPATASGALSGASIYSSQYGSAGVKVPARETPKIRAKLEMPVLRTEGPLMHGVLSKGKRTNRSYNEYIEDLKTHQWQNGQGGPHYHFSRPVTNNQNYGFWPMHPQIVSRTSSVAPVQTQEVANAGGNINSRRFSDMTRTYESFSSHRDMHLMRGGAFKGDGLDLLKPGVDSQYTGGIAGGGNATNNAAGGSQGGNRRGSM